MENIEIVLKAISFASRAHDGQFRRDGLTPYVSHAFRVCLILRHVFGVADDRVLAAAVLHDTIEDTTTDFDDLEKEFGTEIAAWVGALSKDKRKPKKEREEDYADVIRNAPDEAKLIKLADIYDNITDSGNLNSADHLKRISEKVEKYLQVIRSTKSEKLTTALCCVDALIKCILGENDRGGF